MFTRCTSSIPFTRICLGLALFVGGCASPTEEPEPAEVAAPVAVDTAEPASVNPSEEGPTGTTSSEIVVAPYGGFYGAGYPYAGYAVPYGYGFGMPYGYGYAMPMGYGYGYGTTTAMTTATSVSTVAAGPYIGMPGVWGAGMCGWGMPGCGW